jgi:hypothetical protein
MIGKWACAAMATAALALVACMPEQAATYRAPGMAVSPSNGACFTSDDLGVIRARMTQQVFATATLGCKTYGGGRRFNREYTNFLGKFKTDLELNSESLQEMAGRKGFDLDVVLTEMANRTAGRANDPGFCSRIERGLGWSLSPKVTSLTQVPPPYDFSPEMRMVPCAGART